MKHHERREMSRTAPEDSDVDNEKKSRHRQESDAFFIEGWNELIFGLREADTFCL